MKSCQLTIIILILLQIKEQDANNNCGKRLLSHNALITRGHETNEGDWPWHAAIFHLVNFDPKYVCGGTVIASNSVLTAAHCLHESGRRIISDMILVELGTHKLFFGTHTQRFEVYQLISHPEYNTTNLKNDIAIIRLKTEATFNNYVQPICLWDSSNLDISGRSGIVIGWGKTEDDLPSHVLRQVSLPVVRHLTCLSSNSDFFSKYLTDTNFCAGFENGSNLCNGDSGGSLSFKENGVYYLRGIVSLTSSRKDKAFCNSKDYVVFTDIAQYLPWIEEKVPQPRPQHTPRPQLQHRPQLPHRPQIQHRPQPTPPIKMDFTPLPSELSCSNNAGFGLSDFPLKSIGGFSIQTMRRKRDVGLEHCCNLCKDNRECRGYEWTDVNGGTCRLKSGNGDTIGIIGKDNISGQSSSGRSSSVRSSSMRSSIIRSSCSGFACGSGIHNEISVSGNSHTGNGNSKPAECWWSGCQPKSWAERGCYPSNQWRQHNIRNCHNGNEYYCCSTS